MAPWSHLIRFIAREDGAEHIGQVVDTSKDVGLETYHGREVTAYEISGDAFSGTVTDKKLTVEKLLSPISRAQCSYIRCMGLNYADHAKEANLELPKHPLIFTKPRHALADPYPAPTPIPKIAQDGTSDYEAELCVVIGREARDVPKEKALDYVLGFTASNDVSVRSLQLLTSQWGFSKSFDGSCPIGPVLVSPEALGDPHNLSIKAIYDGQVQQDGTTSNLVFNVAEQIAYMSQGTTLEAGTLILTGTPAGVGFLKKPPVVLKDGGEMIVEIEKIGSLVNKIKYE